ncbi:cell division protein DedD [Vibrio sp. UCD-FRSSP16_10]|uniref:SPOR domain-containing protein n=1 Tax=unclassified Vibrio TaxID=2614977 RepID=UPI0007FEE6C2|nr:MULTISPECIES: SPOR domain-containing protein [unclassified Vibrio]OBT15887.1 cell division protein DedD [Vibrio sp. UCD-FRSSP16_10]OBT17781.1 cell division protein DedD [Vibrio sp. UCD-FRSSP16_30]
MASKFQNRLVGTIVLVAVGVIVLPDILDGEKSHYQEQSVAIPIKPQLESEVESFAVVDPVEEEVSLPPEPVEEVIHEHHTQQKHTQPAKHVAEVKHHTKAAAKPTVHHKPEVVKVKERKVAERNQYQDSGWIIQLIALRSEDNANTMAKDLRNSGYRANVVKANNFYRVMVGPDVSRSKLEKQLPKLKKLSGAQGQIQTFKPLKP